MASFRQQALTATQAAEQLDLSRSRFYSLSTEYLRAYARKKARVWIPGISGGDHSTTWPEPVTDLLKKRLLCDPPSPYSFVASEALRLHSFRLDRAQVRRWAIENDCEHPTALKRPRAPVRRWQRAQIGELWQLDATPHPWFPPSPLDFPMLNMLDDCSRLFVASKIYGRELLLSYLDFLPALSWPTDARCKSTSIITPFSSPRTRTRSLNWAGPSSSAASVSFMLQLPRPKEKSSAHTNFGKAASRPTSPVNRSPILILSTLTSMLCASIATPKKPIAS
jgi:hypothetical protein